ncbi:MAG: glycosyltransferase [Pseudomonadota bacterium]
MNVLDLIGELTFAGLSWVFLLYFIGINAGYLMLNFISMFALARYMPVRELEWAGQLQTGLEPAITVIVPAYNEEATIVASVQSLLQLEYTEFEILVINDGSKDDTLDVMMDAFDLVGVDEPYRMELPTANVRGIYYSRSHQNLRVVDKDNGGKADGLNTGINASRYPLFCAIDADSVMARDSLTQVVRPFLRDPLTVAAGGTVRIANGSTVKNGYLVETGLPRNPLALFQIVEYLRAFLFGRMGWSPMNALMIISGAFGLFSKSAVVEAGGYKVGTIGEDAELVVRMHRLFRDKGEPYRIYYVPDPVCWTEGPEDLKTLKNQRVRWQRGLADTLVFNLDLMFHKRGGAVGWVAFPFMFLFEWVGPMIEVSGYIFFTVSFLMGIVSAEGFLTFLAVAVGLGMLLSVTSLLLEELYFTVYKKPRQLFYLFCGLVLENFGFRQLNAYWRMLGVVQWIRGKEGAWGEMKRTASWQKK